MTLWKRRHQRLEEELGDYLERETADNMARGMSREEARAAARRKLGNLTRTEEDTRAAWGFVWIERLLQDLRQARRMLAKNPSFTAVAVLSLAIGVGANCAMFSVADLALLRPLPVPQAGDVVTVGSSKAGAALDQLQASYPDYQDLRDRSQSFEGLVAYTFTRVRFAKQPGALPDLKMGMTVTGNFFRVLGVEPELGRAYRPEEDQAPGRDAVLVLSHSFWEQEFGADPSILGRKVRINDIEFTVIGVAPERFTSIDRWVHPTFYMPVMMNPRLNNRGGVTDPMSYLAKRDVRFLTVKGRMKPGVTVEQARAEVAAIGSALEASYPDTNRNFAMSARTELENRARTMPQAAAMVVMLMVLAGAVLLAACANVASLLTSRAPARAREIAVRLAIGSGRMRLVRQLFTESALLAGAGGILGIGVGYAGVAFLNRFTFVSDIPVMISLRLDERALLFGLAAAVVSVFLFGLVPALRSSRADLVSDLKNAGAVPRIRRFWGRNILVTGQVAVALVLLAVSSFMYIGFRGQLLRGPGYRTNHLLTMEFDPSLVNYTPAETERFYKNLTDRVRDVPGVRSAALASFLPLTQELQTNQIVPEGYEFPEGSDSVGVLTSRVDQHYFDTMAIPIVEGRGFRADDDADSTRVAVVNETMAAQYWPGQSPVGKRFRLDGSDGPWVEIVGVAKDGKYLQLSETPTRFFFLPYAQNPLNDMILMVESAGDPAALTGPVREAVRSLDPEQPIFEVRTMEAFFQMGPVQSSRLLIQFVGAMGLMGMALALTGLYGLVTYAVSTRTREIGIRMAIGAGQGTVLRMVLRQGLTLAVSGVVAGVALSMVTIRLLAAVFPADARANIVAYAVVVPAVLAVTLLAAYIPARRASRIDPLKVLHYE
jgi:putative ABC transport system permease protein